VLPVSRAEAAAQPAAVTQRRADYRPPGFTVEHLELEFDLDPTLTTVAARYTLRPQPDGSAAGVSALLHGEGLELVEATINGRPPAPGQLETVEGGLRLRTGRAPLALRIVNRIRPAANTALIGLYVSNGSLFTQCEAEGFRRITYFPDRPDVMTRYRVTLRGDRAAFPVLLANGNLLSQRELAGGRHEAVWEDPYAKPSYLFALVAGRFVAHESTWRRASGRDALLQVWVDPGHRERTAHAMASLRAALAWDEARFGLELDLDRFMIVASNDFNMGAMENKGLNIFNARYVLATPETATDRDYEHIESIVGHEYFHNWTGNRVTCRDWFQLSLKEGLTVYRDQEFSADSMGDASSRAVRRIDDVRTLRATQFPEDAGPMAHPVRPDAYEAIDNFYTATVYEKGAEVVRMLATLVGREGFRRGLALYFRRHDGQAVTCDDFVAAIADANGRDFTQFRRWYAQAGTPSVRARGVYDAATRSYVLTLAQTTPPTPGQPAKEPLHMPVAVGLLDAHGRDLPLRLDGDAAAGETTRVLELTQPQQSFRFVDVPEPPVPSLLRGFSAPVMLDADLDDAALMFLAAHDSDAFNRWEAGQRLATARLLALADAAEARRALELDEAWIDSMRLTLADPALAPAFKEQALTLPAEGYLGEQRAVVDPDAVRAARRHAMRTLGARLAADWQRAHAAHAVPGPYEPTPRAAGHRALRNLALAYLAAADAPGAVDLARRQFAAADNLTERLGAVQALMAGRAAEKWEFVERVGADWAHEPLLMLKWFQLQAAAATGAGEVAAVARVRALTRHPAYAHTNPNCVFALVRTFCMTNDAEFHRRDGSGYEFWVEQVLLLDRINPMVASRIARALDRWRRYTPDRQTLMRAALARVAGTARLSAEVREIVTKSLEA
jgi:aminopeptidase N